MSKEQFEKDLFEIDLKINSIEQMYKGEKMPECLEIGLNKLYELKQLVVLKAIDAGLVDVKETG